MSITDQIEILIRQQRDLDLNERAAETLRASAFLAVTEIEGVTSAAFADAGVRVYGGSRQGMQNRFNESKNIWGDEFRFGG